MYLGIENSAVYDYLCTYMGRYDRKFLLFVLPHLNLGYNNIYQYENSKIHSNEKLFLSFFPLAPSPRKKRQLRGASCLTPCGAEK